MIFIKNLALFQCNGNEIDRSLFYEYLLIRYIAINRITVQSGSTGACTVQQWL